MSGGTLNRPATRGSLGAVQPVPGRGDLTCDAWGAQLVSIPYSLHHGMFTFDVPSAVWKESLNGTELIGSFTNATSVNGKLNVTSNGVLNDVVLLDTFRHPRYEPNRGHHYAASIFLPSPEAAGTRRFGKFTSEAGWYFELVGDGLDYTLYFGQRTTIDSVTTDRREEIEYFPENWNAPYGNIYDFQAQWRGVGDVAVYLGDMAEGVSKLVHILHNLNRNTELSVFNPALPFAFECVNQGADVVIECGCVDISSEGGKDADGTYGAIPTEGLTGRIAIPGPNQYNTPILAFHVKDTYNSRKNTRDFLNLAFTAYSNLDAVVRVWVTRDPTAVILGTQAWTDFRDGAAEYVQYDPGAGTSLAFDTAKAMLQYGTGIAGDTPFFTDAIFSGKSQLWATPGDYLIFTMHRDNGGAAQVGLTYELSEMI